MKIKGRLVFRGERASEMVDTIAKSLAPDNLSGMETVSEKDTVTVAFTADKISTLLSSVDDYLMNANIVSKLSCIIRRDNV